MTLHTRILIPALLSGAITIGGCARNPVAAPILAPEISASAYAGEWTGKFTDRASGRTGSIVLHFDSGDTTAIGDVLMVPREASSTVMANLVDAAGDRVSGVFYPHTDHTSDCMMITEFTGRRTSANELEGTFTTRIHGTEIVQSGAWSAKRNRSRYGRPTG